MEIRDEIRRVLYDSNVWIAAAAYPGSVPDEAIRLARRGRYRSITSEYIVEEVRRTLSGRFAASPSAVDVVEADMRTISEIITPTTRLSVIAEKDSDNRILECAVAGRANAIVPGDRKHLLRLGEYEGIPLLSPADFLHFVQA